MPAREHACRLRLSSTHTDTGHGEHAHAGQHMLEERRAHTRAKAWPENLKAQPNKGALTRTRVWNSHMHTQALSVTEMATSGDMEWLIALCTDGHTGERKGEEESCPLCPSACNEHFHSLLLAFIALSLPPGVCWPSLLSVVCYSRFMSGFQRLTALAVAAWLALMICSLSTRLLTLMKCLNKHMHRTIMLNLSVCAYITLTWRNY